MSGESWPSTPNWWAPPPTEPSATRQAGSLCLGLDEYTVMRQAGGVLKTSVVVSGRVV